jgi:hypothetical protein
MCPSHYSKSPGPDAAVKRERVRTSMAIGHRQHCVIFDDVETVKELELVTSYSFAKTPSLVIVAF